MSIVNCSSIIIWLLCIISIEGIYIRVNNGEPTYFNSPPARYGVMEFNITNAPLVLADPFDLCSEQSADYSGKIVFATHNGCDATTKLKFARDRGALAVLAHVDGLRRGPVGNFYWRTINGRWAPSDFIPYLAVNTTDGSIIKEMLNNASITDLITGDVYSNAEPNQWKNLLDTSNQYLAVVIVLIVANTAGLGFALSRLISLIMTKGCQRTTSHFTLSFICSGHTSTIIYFTINIIDIKTGPVAPEVVHNIFLVAPELFQLLASLIVSLYWFELINSVSSRPISFVTKLVKPFIAFAVIITALYVLAMIMFAFHISDVILVVFYLVYVAISIVSLAYRKLKSNPNPRLISKQMVATIWIIVGAKMIYYINRRESKDEKSKNFNRLSALIIVCAVFLVITRIFYLWLGLDPSVAGYPQLWLIVQTLIFIFQLATAFIQTGLFKFHKRDFKSSSKGSSDMSKTTTKATGSSFKLTATAASKIESIAVETIVENMDEVDLNNNGNNSLNSLENKSTEDIKLVPTVEDDDDDTSKSESSSSSDSTSSSEEKSNSESASGSGSQIGE